VDGKCQIDCGSRRQGEIGPIDLELIGSLVSEWGERSQHYIAEVRRCPFLLGQQVVGGCERSQPTRKRLNLRAAFVAKRAAGNALNDREGVLRRGVMKVS